MQEKGKIDKLDFLKIKNIMKLKTQRMGKNIWSYISQGLISKIL
jgi:hypothetical protein